MSLRFARLTRPSIRALDVGEAITEHGIKAERLATGDVRYSVNVMVDGERIHRVVGRESDGVTRQQAEDATEQLRTQAREGRLKLARARKTAMSFSEGAGKYLERLDASGGKNVVRKRQHLDGQLVPHFGTLRLEGVKEFAVKAYRKKRREAGLNDATINRELATLSHLLRSAARWHWIRKDDVPEIDKTRETGGRIVALTDDQSSALLRASIVDQDPDLWLFTLAGLSTGMRHTEITRQRLELMDLDRLRVFIPQAKAGAREQPITKAYAEALRAEIERRGGKAEGWLFPSAIAETKDGRRCFFTKQFRRAVIRAGLDPKQITPHVMRHTAVTRLVKSGVDIPTIMRVSGHKTAAMVLRYSHVDAPHIDAAASNLNIDIPCAVTPELHTGPNLVDPPMLRSVA